MTDSRDLIEVASFQQLFEAEIFAGKLQSEGIPAFVQDVHSISLRPHLALALGGIKVQVRRKDLAAARALLSEINGPAATSVAEKCPACSSENTEVVKEYSWKSLLNVFTFPINFSLYRKSFRCKACGKSWR